MTDRQTPDRRQDEQGTIGDEPERPPFSHQGNPYPPGLEPVYFDMTGFAGVPPERILPRPFDGPPPPPDFSGLLTTRKYLYETFEPGVPRFKLRLAPRRASETDAQYEAYRREVEYHYRVRGQYLAVCRAFCTHLGNHLHCAERSCRRKGHCAGRRDEDRFDLDFAMFPPCIPLDLEIIETYRTAINAELERVAAEGRPE